MYYPSPAAQIVAEDFTEDLLQQGKIRRSEFQIGRLLFFAEEVDKLRVVIDNRALYKIMKISSAPITITDEMINQVGRSEVFSKNNLETGFQILSSRKDEA